MVRGIYVTGVRGNEGTRGGHVCWGDCEQMTLDEGRGRAGQGGDGVRGEGSADGWDG